MLVELTNFDQARQQWLATELHQRYGHTTHEDAAAGRREALMARVKDIVFSNLCTALKSLKNTNGGTGGRANNHYRVVRQVLLAVASASLPNGSKTAVAAELNVYPRDLRKYR